MNIKLCKSQWNDQVTILELEGRIDAYTHTVVQEKLHELMTSGIYQIVCNFENIDYIGPAGLQTFLTLIQKAREKGGDILLNGLAPYVQRKFEFAGFGDVCEFYKDLDEAVKVFDKNKQIIVPIEDDETKTFEENTSLTEEEISGKTQKLDSEMIMQEREKANSHDSTLSAESSKNSTVQFSSQTMRTISQKIEKMEGETEEKTHHEKKFSYSVNYYICRKMGEGYLGKLYLGHQECNGFKRPIVMKYIKTQYTDNMSIMQLLTQELQQVSRVTHQNIPHIYKLVTLDNYRFVVAEYVEGVTLGSIFQKLRQLNRIFPPDIASHIIYTLCGTMHYVNCKKDDRGEKLEAIHGEICSENIILNKDFDIKILDLGLARIKMMLQFQQAPERLKHLDFLAPEVIDTGIPGISGDIFAIGVLFYEMLTGNKPYSTEQIQQRRLVLPPPPSHFNKRVNEILDGIVLRCIIGDPYRRFSDYQDVALQLEEFLSTKGFLMTQAAFKQFVINNKFLSE